MKPTKINKEFEKYLKEYDSDPHMRGNLSDGFLKGIQYTLKRLTTTQIQELKEELKQAKKYEFGDFDDEDT